MLELEKYPSHGDENELFLFLFVCDSSLNDVTFRNQEEVNKRSGSSTERDPKTGTVGDKID